MQYASSKCQVSNELKPWNPRLTKASKPEILFIRLKSRYHVSKKVLSLEIFEMTNLLNSYGSEVLLKPSEIFWVQFSKILGIFLIRVSSKLDFKMCSGPMWHTLEPPLVLPSSFMSMFHFHVVEFNWTLCLMSQPCLRIPETDLIRNLIISPHRIQLS